MYGKHSANICLMNEQQSKVGQKLSKRLLTKRTTGNKALSPKKQKQCYGSYLEIKLSYI